jgi:hypothetical protein
MWPVGFAIQEWTPAVEKRIAELVAAALPDGGVAGPATSLPQVSSALC